MIPQPTPQWVPDWKERIVELCKALNMTREDFEAYTRKIIARQLEDYLKQLSPSQLAEIVGIVFEEQDSSTS